jgi:hypothetical protein
MALGFVPSESAFAYFEVLQRYLATHGKPVAFYSDKHSIFASKGRRRFHREPYRNFRCSLKMPGNRRQQPCVGEPTEAPSTNMAPTEMPAIRSIQSALVILLGWSAALAAILVEPLAPALDTMHMIAPRAPVPSPT